MIEIAGNAATLVAIFLAGIDSGLMFDRLDPGTPVPGFLSLLVVSAGVALLWYAKFQHRHNTREPRTLPGKRRE